MTRVGYDRYCAEIVAQTDLLRSRIAGADLTVPVPSCPGWKAGQLLRHLGGGHRWVEAIVRSRRHSPSPTTISATSPDTPRIRTPLPQEGDDRMSSDHVLLDQHAQDLLFRAARTANTFTDEPVTDEQIAALYELVKWAPTSFNQQPLRVALIRSPEARSRLVPLMSEGNQSKTATAPLVAVLAADFDFHENLPTQFPAFPQAKDVFFKDEEVRVRSALLNATLQVAYFILGVRAIGLAAGPMTGFHADKVSEKFFPGGRHRALVVVNIGKPGPNAWHDRLPRLAYDQVFTSH